MHLGKMFVYFFVRKYSRWVQVTNFRARKCERNRQIFGQKQPKISMSNHMFDVFSFGVDGASGQIFKYFFIEPQGDFETNV